MDTTRITFRPDGSRTGIMDTLDTHLTHYDLLLFGVDFQFLLEVSLELYFLIFQVFFFSCLLITQTNYIR